MFDYFFYHGRINLEGFDRVVGFWCGYILGDMLELGVSKICFYEIYGGTQRVFESYVDFGKG